MYCLFLTKLNQMVSAVIIPAGPVTYYNQYETTNYLTLSTASASWYQWYKNDIAIPGATGQNYTISFIRNTTYTDYYKVETSCGTHYNDFTFNYIGCDDVSDYPGYPSFVTPDYWCAQSNPTYTLVSPNLGIGTTYIWWKYNSPSEYTFSNYSGNTCQLSSSNYGWEGIYSRSSRNGQEVYMYYTIYGDAYCKTLASDRKK